MGGTFDYRVNETWLNSTLPSNSCFRFFWHLLNYFIDHPDYSIVQYGTETTPGGTGDPTGWTSWPPAFSDNAWFVVQADLSSELLDGSGSRQWQCKFQIFNSSSGGGFDDCSGQDYGEEGSYELICKRFSSGGGWNTGTLDFSDTTEPVEDNINIFSENDLNWKSHIIGDGDTTIIYGQNEDYATGRTIYLGQTVRSHAEITKPELSFAGRINSLSAGPDYRMITSKNSLSGYSAFSYTVSCGWPSISVASDGTTAINAHEYDAGDEDFMVGLSANHWTGDDNLIGILVRENQSPNYGLLGQLRLIRAVNETAGEGVLLGSNNWIQLASDSGSYGGIALKWPPAETPGF